MGFLKNVIMIIIIILLLVFGIKQQVDLNSVNDEIKDLEKQLQKVTDEKDRLEYELNMSDDEYLDKKAREQFLDPDAQHFQSDYNG